MYFAIYHNALNIDKGGNHINKIKSSLDKRGRLPLKNNFCLQISVCSPPFGNEVDLLISTAK